MKIKILIPLLIVFSSMLKSQSLDGTWKLVAYGHIPSKSVNRVKDLPDKFVIIKINYDEYKGSGTISGQCGPNKVKGTFTTTADYKFRVQQFKGSQFPDPYKFSQNFHRTMNLSKNYKIHHDTMLQIYFNNNFEFALLQRLQPNHKVYYNEKICNNPWDTTACDSTLKQNIIEWFQEENYFTQLSPEKIEFVNGSDLETGCDKCKCGTGRKIVLQVIELDAMQLVELSKFAEY